MNDREQKLDEGCFAGAVGSQQAVSNAGLDLERDAVHGANHAARPEAAEVLGEAVGFNNRRRHAVALLLVYLRKGRRGSSRKTAVSCQPSAISNLAVEEVAES